MSSEIIVLVPGLWMPSTAFSLQGLWLKEYFPTHRFGYPSVRGNLTSNKRRLAKFCDQFSVDRIHFVCHSLGGLITLAMLRDQATFPVGRVVLLGVPVAGNQVASKLMRMRLPKILLGASICEWLTQSDNKGTFDCEIGVISGRKSFGAGRFVASIPRPNDGVVTVAESTLSGAKDSIVLDVSHSGMLFSREVATQIAAFITTGVFTHE